MTSPRFIYGTFEHLRRLQRRSNWLWRQAIAADCRSDGERASFDDPPASLWPVIRLNTAHLRPLQMTWLRRFLATDFIVPMTIKLALTPTFHAE